MNYLASPWVVIPTYNEISNIGQMIDQLFALPIENLSVLIVDDSSPDGTGEAVKKLQEKYPRLNLEVRSQKNGLGKAYVHGFKVALSKGATALVQMDADFSHDPTDIPKLLEQLQDNDLVIGSRYVNGISVVNWPLRRLLISMGGSLYARLITGMPLADSTAGFKAWRADALQAVNLNSVDADGYGFQIVTNYRTWRAAKKIKEVPIIFTERRVGQSKMSKAIIFEALWLVWKLRFFE